METEITLCHLRQSQILRINGPDAKKFLQGQVTCDINLLDKKDPVFVPAPLGAHCTHKGRILFSFRAIEIPPDNDTQTIALSIPSDISDIAIAALKKYSVFSKVDIDTDKETYQLFGINGKNAESTLRTLVGDQEAIPTEANTALITSSTIIVCIAKECYELWLTTAQAQDFTERMSDNKILDDEYWNEIKIKAGIADIHANTSGMFTPHAINYHNIGNAVSFTKGCYTGQEVVARMQYLGQLKRQLYLFVSKETMATQPAAGDSLYVKDKTQSIGEVAMVSHYHQNTYLLASTVVEHAEKDRVFADSHYQHALERVSG